MNGAQKRWEVQLLDSQYHPESLVVHAVNGRVVLVASGRAYIVPPQADDGLCEAIREARAATESPTLNA